MIASIAVMAALDGLAGGAAASWPEWLLAGIFAVFGVATLAWMLTHPALARRRLRSGPQFERAGVQRVIVLVFYAALVALFLVTLLDVHFHWASPPGGAMLLGDALVAAGLLLVFLVFVTNEFAGASVRVETGQRVISTGPYALIRHPMYTGLLLLFLGAPLGAGSLWGLAVFPALAAVLVWRLMDEERYLAASLPGYREYAARVRWRLLPGVW